MSEADRLTPDALPIEHVHLGAGSFGLGMVVEICNGQAGLKTAVVNRHSEKQHHKILQAKGSYSVLFDSDENRRKILKPEFYYHTAQDEDRVVDLLASPSVSLITTAVRKSNFAVVAPLLARALTKRSQRGTDAQDLCVIACENLTNNSVELQKHVESHVPLEKRQHLLEGVFFCNSLVDRVCAPISCLSGAVEIPVEFFHNWIVQSPDTELPVLELLQGKGLIELARSEAEFRVHETQKYWCMNGVHMAAAAYAYNNNRYLKHFSQALANPAIAKKIKALQQELLSAFLLYVSELGLQDRFTGEMGYRYNTLVFQRLKRNRTDTIGRVLKLDEGSGAPHAVLELLDRVERLMEPQCTIMALRKGLVNPKFESIALHPVTQDVDERLELDDALQQVIFAMRAFMRDYATQRKS